MRRAVLKDFLRPVSQTPIQDVNEGKKKKALDYMMSGRNADSFVNGFTGDQRAKVHEKKRAI